MFKLPSTIKFRMAAGLVVSAVVLLAVLTLYGWANHWFNVGDELQRHIAKLGGKIERVPQYTDGIEDKDLIRYKVDLRGIKITDDDLVLLAKSKEISQLDLAFTPVTDSGMLRLAAMAELAVVNLTGTKITDAGLAKVAELCALCKASISRTPPSPTRVWQI